MRTQVHVLEVQERTSSAENITTLDVRTLNNVRAKKNVQPTQQNIFNNFPHRKSYEVQVTFLFFLIFYRKREREGIAVATQ